MNSLQIIIQLGKVKETVCANCYRKYSGQCFIWRKENTINKITPILQEIVNEKNTTYFVESKKKYKQLLTEGTCPQHRSI